MICLLVVSFDARNDWGNNFLLLPIAVTRWQRLLHLHLEDPPMARRAESQQSADFWEIIFDLIRRFF